MTRALRESLKVAVDQAVRAQVLPRPGTPGCCVGCGMPWDTETPECKRCSNRHKSREPERRGQQQAWHKWKLATDAEYRERRRVLDSERRQRDRQRARERAVA